MKIFILAFFRLPSVLPVVVGNFFILPPSERLSPFFRATGKRTSLPPVFAFAFNK
jgi:hypothetical protein